MNMRNVVRGLVLLALPLLLLGCDGGRRQEMEALVEKADSMNRGYVSMANGMDSLLRDAVDYYDRHGTPNEQMRAHYLLGCAYRDMGEAPAALQSYQDAVDCADTTSTDCDYKRLMSVYGQMAELFHAQNLPEDELEYREQCRRCAQQMNDTLMLIRCVELSAKPYFLLGDTIKMINSLLKAQQLYNQYGFSKNAVAIYPPIIDIYISQDSLQKAKELMELFESKSGLFDSDGNISSGREGYYELKGLYYLKVHKLDSAEIKFRKLLRVNKTSNNAEAYKGLFAVFKEKENVDSIKKFVQLFENAVYRERGELQTYAIHQISSLYNYYRFIEKANVESRKAARIKSFLMLSVLLIAIVILIAIIVVLNLAHKKKIRENEAETLRRDYSNAIDKKEQIEKELEILRSNHAQLMKSEETTKIKLASVNANNELLMKEKEKEIAELNGQIREYASLYVAKGNLIGNNPQFSLLLDDLHRRSLRKKNTSLPTKSDWERLVRLFAQTQPVAYATIGRENVLSTQELRACVLLLLNFTNGEIISLLDISSQGMTNIRKRINDKLFNEAKASTLDRNMQSVAIV